MLPILFLLISFTSFISAMSPIVALKDNQNNVVANTDVKTLQDLQSLSSHIAAQPVEEITEGNQKKYVISTGLPKKLITFLLQLNANIEPEKFSAALDSQAISLNNIERTEIPLLGLPSKLQKAFDDLLIIETASDNQYAALKKRIAMDFFSTLADFAQEFENQFIISMKQIKKNDLVTLYKLVHPLTMPESFLEEAKIIDSIKPIIQSKTLTELFSLLEAANFLGAKSFLLTALFEVYKTYFPKEEIWKNQLTTHPFLKNIASEIKYFSIEQLLKDGKSDFYSFQEVQDPETKKSDLVARISGSQIYYLKGINLIPKIQDCKVIIIENTKIAILRTKDLDNLNNLVYLRLLNNTDLSVLEKNSLRKFNLEALEISNSKINNLSPEIFILPNLKILEFNHNKIKIIKSDWAKDLGKLEQLTLEEPELTILEPGWLNGLKKLNFLEVSAKINPALDAQIRDDLSAYPEISYIKPGSL